MQENALLLSLKANEMAAEYYLVGIEYYKQLEADSSSCLKKARADYAEAGRAYLEALDNLIIHLSSLPAETAVFGGLTAEQRLSQTERTRTLIAAEVKRLHT
jgi:hypothetical protein